MNSIEFAWRDRKRHFGLPISFTKYSLSEDRLFRETGLLNLKEDEVLLYRVRDFELTRTLWQRICGVGTVCVISSDKSCPHLDLVNIRHPKAVKEQIHQAVEEAKNSRRMRTTELLDSSGAEDADFDMDMEGHE